MDFCEKKIGFDFKILGITRAGVYETLCLPLKITWKQDAKVRKGA